MPQAYPRVVPLTQAQEEVFWSRVVKTENCWEYAYDVTVGGYGRFWDGRRRWYAHVVSYFLLVGESPEGTELDHTCSNKVCVNPAHLDPVTHAVNVKRGNSGILNRERTECVHGHPFDAANTYLYTYNGNQHRACKTCKCERKRAQRHGANET